MATPALLVVVIQEAVSEEETRSRVEEDELSILTVMTASVLKPSSFMSLLEPGITILCGQFQSCYAHLMEVQ